MCNPTSISTTTRPTYIHSQSSQLLVTLPPPQPKTLQHYILLYAVFPILAPAFVTFKCLTNTDFRRNSINLYGLVSGATSNPISNEWYFQNKNLLDILWNKPSAKCYVDETSGEPLLEYQISEGYCGSATQRCILRSFGFSPESIPEQKRGETKPDPWCEHITNMARESCHKNADGTAVELDTKIVHGDVDYQDFLNTLRKGTSDPNCRIAVNFLRPALMGFSGFRFLPMNFILGLLGGHFSPIVGMIEAESVDVDAIGAVDASVEKIETDNPLVAVWDTNHKYDGAYFVPARRLYESVKAVDLGSNKNRALILVEKKN